MYPFTPIIYTLIKHNIKLLIEYYKLWRSFKKVEELHKLVESTEDLIVIFTLFKCLEDIDSFNLEKKEIAVKSRMPSILKSFSKIFKKSVVPDRF